MPPITTTDETIVDSSTPPAAASDDGWSDEEIESMLGTAILVGVATLVVYYVILRPMFNPKPHEGGAAGGEGGARNNNNNMANDVARRQRQPTQLTVAAGARAPARAAVGGGADATASLPSSVASGKRRPPHLADSCSGGPSGSRYLVEGLVPFRRSLAASYESSKNANASQGDEDIVAANRKLRARLLARLLNPTLTGAQTKTPPARGSNIIVCVPSADVGCAKLHQALYLLGTYFNLFLVLTLSPNDDAGGAARVDESDQEKELLDNLRAQLRGSAAGAGITMEVLPDHRIVASRTVEGKVAFVRQMHRPEFVLDCDAEMKTQLERFGFMVLLYGQGDEKTSSDGVSLLGKTLIA
jgi:hypothetical protein